MGLVGTRAHLPGTCLMLVQLLVQVACLIVSTVASCSRPDVCTCICAWPTIRYRSELCSIPLRSNLVVMCRPSRPLARKRQAVAVTCAATDAAAAGPVPGMQVALTSANDLHYESDCEQMTRPRWVAVLRACCSQSMLDHQTSSTAV